MVAVPAVSVVARPLLFTVATAVFELLHVIVRPVSTLLAASRVTAVACDVPPTATDVGVSDTVTLATGTAVTVSTALPLWPSLVAVMVVVPAASVVATPLLFTVATAVFELLHVIVRPVRTVFDALRVTAVPCDVAPTATDVGASDTVTLATGTAVTESTALPL